MHAVLAFIVLLLSARYSLATNDWISPSGPVTIQFGTTYDLKWGNLSPGNISLDLYYNFQEHGSVGHNSNDTAQTIIDHQPNTGSCTFTSSKDLALEPGPGRYWFTFTAFGGGEYGNTDSPDINMIYAGGNIANSAESSSSASSTGAIGTSQPAAVSTAAESNSVGGALMPSVSSGSSTAMSTSTSPATTISSVVLTLQVSTVASAPAVTSNVPVIRTSLDSQSAVVIVTQMRITTIAGVAPATFTLTWTAPGSSSQDSASTSSSKSSSDTVLSVPTKIGIGAGSSAFGLAMIALCLWLALRNRFNSHGSFRGRQLRSNEPLPERMEENRHAFDGQIWTPGIPPQNPKHSDGFQHKQSHSQINAPRSYPSDPSLPRHATFDVSSNKNWFHDGGQTGGKTSSLKERHCTSQAGPSRSLPSAMSSPRVNSEYGLGGGCQNQGRQQGLAITEQGASMQNRTAYVSLPTELASPQFLSEADGVVISELGSPQETLSRINEVRFELPAEGS